MVMTSIQRRSLPTIAVTRRETSPTGPIIGQDREASYPRPLGVPTPKRCGEKNASMTGDRTDHSHDETAADLSASSSVVTRSKAATHSETISVDALRTGMRLTNDLYDESGILLLSAGTRITPRFLAALKRRGICRIQLQPTGGTAPANDLRGLYERKLDELVAGVTAEATRESSVWGNRRTELSVENLVGESLAGLERHSDAGSLLQDIASNLCAGGMESAEPVAGVVNDFADMLSLDADILPTIVSLQEPQNEYLFDHCVNVSLLSMTTGMHLGLPREKVMELGIGTMLQDIGMLRVPDEIRFAPRILTPDERVQIRRHPVYTLDTLEHMEGIAPVSVFVGYQVHERLDGSGYPRGRSGMFIHQYARIAAIADIYAAMTRPRPHRPAYLPYQAIREVLLNGRDNKLDRVILRSFLDCLSLFPIGSFVELNGGTRTKVVRSNPGLHTRPVVVETDESGQVRGDPIDLGVETAYQIVRVLPPRENSSAEAAHAPTS